MICPSAEVTGIGDAGLLEAYRVQLSALSDPEDAPPAFRFRPMPNDDQNERDSRNTITMPPPSEPTKTDNEVPAPLNALRPAPPGEWDTEFLKNDDSVFSAAVRMVAKAGKLMSEDREERRKSEETAAARHAEQLEQGAKIIAAVDRADQNSEKNYALIRVEIGHLKDSDIKQDARLKEGDKRFDQIEEKVAGLEAQLEQIRGLIADLRKNESAGPAPAAVT